MLSGKKTFIAAGVGIAFNVLGKMGFLPDGITEASMAEFVNTLLIFATFIFARMGMNKK